VWLEVMEKNRETSYWDVTAYRGGVDRTTLVSNAAGTHVIADCRM
jgi:hypothetical protein